MTRIDVDKYRSSIKSIKEHLDAKPEAERISEIKFMVLRNYVPIYIAACYVGEIYGFTLELLNYIDGLMTFYHIDELINIQAELGTYTIISLERRSAMCKPILGDIICKS